MGCSPSLPLGFEWSSERKIESGVLEHFSIGNRLGQGAFGVVSTCRRRQTGEELAVKIVDSRVHNLNELLAEADMMQRLSHPSIVKFHNLYHDGGFIYIVMDAYLGGDLVDGLQAMMKTGPLLDCSKVIHIQKQMTASIEYLHTQGVVHRDVKGDNFLVDRDDIADPDCRVALADFGAACDIAPGERLRKVVGTAKFSAPEVFDRDYGQKVDTWALGVVMYGLVSGRFPFRNEKEVRNKEVRMTTQVDATCQDLILTLLDKREESRPTAREAAAHPWLQPRRSQMDVEAADKISESESTTMGDEEDSDPCSSEDCRSQPLKLEGRKPGDATASKPCAPAPAPPGGAAGGARSSEGLLDCFAGLARCRTLLPGSRPEIVEEIECSGPLLRVHGTDVAKQMGTKERR